MIQFSCAFTACYQYTQLTAASQLCGLPNYCLPRTVMSERMNMPITITASHVQNVNAMANIGNSVLMAQITAQGNNTTAIKIAMAMPTALNLNMLTSLHNSYFSHGPPVGGKALAQVCHLEHSTQAQFTHFSTFRDDVVNYFVPDHWLKLICV